MSFARKFRRNMNSRQPTARFIVRGKFNANGTVSFPRTGLDAAQQAFLAKCENVIHAELIPNLKQQGATLTDQDALAYVMYNNPKDFMVNVMEKLNGTPDEAWQELYDLFNSYNHNHDEGLRLGSSLTRQEIVSHGGEQAGFFFDRLNDGGIWRWPNAHAVLQKRGNRVVVIEKI